MKTQDPKERVKNFNEVALGLTEDEAKNEAARCLQCKKALCVGGCPVEINIPEFINLISEGKFGKAAEKIREKTRCPRFAAGFARKKTNVRRHVCLHGKMRQ